MGIRFRKQLKDEDKAESANFVQLFLDKHPVPGVFQIILDGEFSFYFSARVATTVTSTHKVLCGEGMVNEVVRLAGWRGDEQHEVGLRQGAQRWRPGRREGEVTFNRGEKNRGGCSRIRGVGLEAFTRMWGRRPAMMI